MRGDLKDIKRELEFLQGQEDGDPLPRYKSLSEHMVSILVKEEVYWKQRVKIHWLQNGDKNTSFFHKMASARKKTNIIGQLVNQEGEMVEEQARICKVVREYFLSLFMIDEDNYEPMLDALASLVGEEDNNLLISNQQREFRKALY